MLLGVGQARTAVGWLGVVAAPGKQAGRPPLQALQKGAEVAIMLSQAVDAVYIVDLA